jgi:hypothetical protein
MTRSFTWIVSSIDSEGIQKGWTKKVLINTAMTRAVSSSPGSSAQKERFFFFGLTRCSGRGSSSGSG